MTIPAWEPPSLDTVFKYGQNEFQTYADMPSVGVGDVIEWDGRLYLVARRFFKIVDEVWYNQYMQQPREDRLRQAGMEW